MSAERLQTAPGSDLWKRTPGLILREGRTPPQPPLEDLDAIGIAFDVWTSERKLYQSGTVERFLAFLWDIGLEVGHSVRTIDDCQKESLADISVACQLINLRHAGVEIDAGIRELFERGQREGEFRPDLSAVWLTEAFYDLVWVSPSSMPWKYMAGSHDKMIDPSVFRCGSVDSLALACC